MLLRSRGSDDDIGAASLLVQLLERDYLRGAGDGVRVVVRDLHGDLVGDLPGDQRGFLLGAVGHQDARGSLLDEVARGQLGHLARAHQQYGLALQAAEDLARQIDRDRGNRHRRAADLRLCADPFGHREGALQQRVERAGNGSHLAGHGIRFLHLAQDLRLADDHRIQRRGHPEQMANGLAIAKLVKVGLNVVRGDREVLMQEAHQVGVRLPVTRVLVGDEFHAIAGGNNQAFADSGQMHQRADRIRQAGRGDGQPLAHLDRCGGVVHADQHQRAFRGVPGRRFLSGLHDRQALGIRTHGVANLCTAENWLAAHTNRTTRITKLER